MFLNQKRKARAHGCASTENQIEVRSDPLENTKISSCQLPGVESSVTPMYRGLFMGAVRHGRAGQRAFVREDTDDIEFPPYAKLKHAVGARAPIAKGTEGNGGFYAASKVHNAAKRTEKTVASVLGQLGLNQTAGRPNGSFVIAQ